MKKLLELNKRNIPMINTHYYHWLKDLNLTDIHAITTKKSYLLSLGVDKITENELETLKAIESCYFYNEVVKKQRGSEC